MQHDIQHEYVIMPDNYVNIRLDVLHANINMLHVK